ncbi:MAG: hypothetical protein ACW98K_16675 [Candidatus Kariarchaeaceae archaeon]
MSNEEAIEGVKIEKIESTTLDQFVQILEISFIFLLTYTLITLFDATVASGLDLYANLAEDYLGREGIGSLQGGRYEEIVRVTLIFNLLLFSFSLFFGLWMRRTRDNWSFGQLGFTLKTPDYSSRSIIERGLILGLLAVAIQFTIMTPVVWQKTGNFDSAILGVHTFYNSGTSELFTSRELQAEYYFGFVEMGFIWPLSAGFFFFAYAHNSLRAKFPVGIANLFATLFYVFYLAYFFMIPQRGKLNQLNNNNDQYLGNSVFWAQLFVFFIILYISFSAFAETKSIVLPFLLNFVLNVGLTLFKSFNALAFDSVDNLMLLPYFLSVIFLIYWGKIRTEVFSTLRLGVNHLKDLKLISFRKAFGFTALFISFALIIPSIFEHLIFSEKDYDTWIPYAVAILYFIIISLSIVVLTYEPTEVYDVLLINNDGLPIASHIELFQSDEVLISGFFTALSSVSEEFDSDPSELKSVRRGERELLIEDGVLTRIVALADKDQPSIRDSIIKMHKSFEISNSDQLRSWSGTDIKAADDLVDDIGKLSVKFSIPQQTRWLGTLTLAFTPLFLVLLGLMNT